MNYKITHFRKLAGVSQEQLAELLGCTSKTLYNWERGLTYPDALQIWEMCEALKTTPNELLGWDNPSKNSIEDSYERRLIEDYRACSPSRKGKLLEYAADNALLSKNDRVDNKA